MPLRLGTDMPALSGATLWINGAAPPATADKKATLVHFWAVSCHICHETMEDLLAMRDRYAPAGLQLVGVHLPRMAEDADETRVRADIDRYGISQPVALDHARAIADRYQNEYVPAFFLFDQDGHLTFRAAGDKGFEKLETKIAQTLGITEGSAM
jgi:thiol-disulfide isomerase/thioredoxin